MCGMWWRMRSARLSPGAGGIDMSSFDVARFDVLAPHYDWMEAVLAGRKLERCREALIGYLPEVRNVLLVGEGHGKFLAEILRRNPEAEITCVDASARMLEVSRGRLERMGLPHERVRFVCADVREAELPVSELVVTNFFLDCLTEEQLEAVTRRLSDCLRPGGRWLVADFQIPPTGWKRVRAQWIHWLMYRFFRAVTRLPASGMHQPAPYLQRSGLMCEERREFDWGLLYSELWRK